MGQILALLTQLGVNQSFFVMFGLFAVTYFTVSALLNRPLAHLLVERETRTVGRQEEISKIRVELTNIAETLASERKNAQAQAGLKFAELKGLAVNEQRKILADARDDFSSQVKTAREKGEKSFAEEKQKLDRTSSELKDEMVAKLLGVGAAKNLSLGKEI